MTLDETLNDYAAAWSAADDDARATLLARVWAKDAVYCDPQAKVEGRDALHAHIGAMHAKLPGARVELTTGVSLHHDRLYFGWRMVLADGVVRVEGVDFGTLDPEGRISGITGFFGPPGA